MPTYVKFASRVIAVEQIAYALLYPQMTIVYPVRHSHITLTGDEAQRINEALKAAGFIGDGALINPERVSVIEDAGSSWTVFIEGSDRVVHIPPEQAQQLFPTLETPPLALDPAPEAVARAPRKKGSEPK